MIKAAEFGIEDRRKMDERRYKYKQSNGKKNLKRNESPQKQFEHRNSLLTDLQENNPHIKTVYHIFMAVLINLFVNTVIYDFSTKGKTTLGTQLIYAGFGRLHISICYWLYALSLTILSYYLFNVWAYVILELPPQSKYLKVCRIIGMATLVTYYILSFQAASVTVTTFKLPPASASIVVLEQVRFLMKTHAFVRHNVEKVVKYKTHSDQDLNLPELAKFLYFLFAPTLVYRDEYPRTTKIRWNFVLFRLLDIIGIIYYYSFIFYRFVFPVFEDFGKRKFTWNEIILGVFENSIPGLLLFLSGFYLILHSVQNVFAEILRFGDREFYREWWTCNNYSDYFRLWNIIVYDWLYTYIYKDVYELVIANKPLAKLTVFITSAVVHEWVLSHITGFFFPLLFTEFFVSGICSLIKFPNYGILKVLFWYGLMFGNGTIVGLYTLEYFARKNVPVENVTWKSILIPRWITCDCIQK